MATKKEEEDEQEFFAEKVKEQEKMEKHTKAEPKAVGDEYRDSVGQPNPAYEFEKKNIEEAQKRTEEKEKEAKKENK